MLKEAISKRFKELRNSVFHMTQPEFGSLIGVERHVIAQIEVGRSYPNLEILNELAINHNINLNWLISGIGDRKISKGNKTKLLDFNESVNNQLDDVEGHNIIEEIKIFKSANDYLKEQLHQAHRALVNLTQAQLNYQNNNNRHHNSDND